MAACSYPSVCPGNLLALHWLSCEGMTVVLMSREQAWEWATTSPAQPCDSLLWIKEDKHEKFTPERMRKMGVFCFV